MNGTSETNRKSASELIKEKLAAQASSPSSADNPVPKGKTYFFLHDTNKNVSAMTDEQGELVATYEYSPFGTLVQASGPMAKENAFRFSSEFQDEELRLVYYNHRYYHPIDGRWISRDPIHERGGNNLYAFVKNRPTHKTDYLGEQEAEKSIGEEKCKELVQKSIASPPRRLKKVKSNMKEKKCRLPRIYCLCGGNGARATYYAHNNSISLWYNKIADTKDFYHSILHEYVHAFQYCKGMNGIDCEDQIARELEANYLDGRCEKQHPDKGQLFDECVIRSAVASSYDWCKTERNIWAVAKKLYSQNKNKITL